MPLDPSTFEKCAPSLGTNVKQCGTVTICNAIPTTVGELATLYKSGSDYRVMEALLFHDMEIRMCETVQNGLYDFLMANKVNMSKRIQTRRANSGLIQIAPFILSRQYSPINNEYWLISGGTDVNPDDWDDETSGGTVDWVVDITSSANIPADVRSFALDQRIYIDGQSAGGSATKTAWKVVGYKDNGDDTLTLALESENAASNLDADKLEYPVAGVAKRGSANKGDFEQYCAEPPAYMNWKDVPFWFETTRTSMCKSSLYDQWRKLLLEGNALYREYGDLDDIEKNKQLGADWMKRICQNFFWSKPLANQTLAAYDNLEDINTFNGGDFGVDGGRCVGKRANVVGVYEQMAECSRIHDAQGDNLNLVDLWTLLYQIMRTREAAGRPVTSIDIFTDTTTADAINRAMIKYYSYRSADHNDTATLRLTMPVNQEAKKANFGFNYRSYTLFWPPGLVVNIVTHYFFDDYIAAATAAGIEDTARVLWILDFAGIYPGILASKRVELKTGDLRTLAAVNPDFACVMEVPTQMQSLTSMSYCVIVECPTGNAIIENFIVDAIEFQNAGGGYLGTGTTTTTTTAAP